MTPEEVYDLARAEDLPPDVAAVAVAIAMGESGLDPEAIGDVNLADDIWGPSIGLWLIRSLRADKGTRRSRDADMLMDPYFNTKAMRTLSGNGTDFTPWTVYRTGGYKRYLNDVRAAVDLPLEAEMEVWHPRARRAVPNVGSGPYSRTDPWKIVLHTVEGKGDYRHNPASYFGHQSWPHCTIDRVGIHQHYPIDQYAKALANKAGGVETNRARAIQCEIFWTAADIANLPDDIMRHLGDWVNWCCEQTGARRTFATFRGNEAYGPNGASRFLGQRWLSFDGICGHQHVPENDHWDPGAIDTARLEVAMGGTTPTPPAPNYGIAWVSLAEQYVIDLPGRPTTAPNGTRLAVAECDAGADQFFDLHPQANGLWCLKHRLSGKVIDVDAPAVNSNGAKVQLWDYTPGALNQQFEMIFVGPGVVVFRCAASEQPRVLDVSRPGVDGPIHLWNRHDQANQLWTTVRVAPR